MIIISKRKKKFKIYLSKSFCKYLFLYNLINFKCQLVTRFWPTFHIVPNKFFCYKLVLNFVFKFSLVSKIKNGFEDSTC